MSYSLFCNEEEIIRQAEDLSRDFSQKATEVQLSIRNLIEAYSRSYREQQRLVRVSDRQQEQLRQMTLELKEKTRQMGEQALHLQALNNALEGEIRARMQLESELRKLAATDALTGLHNRRRFLEIGDYELRRRTITRKPLTLIMLDLDFFKDVNDRYGHAAGDEALALFASLCAKSIRPMDIAGRLGGEEFGILLPETDMKDGLLVAERLRCTVAAHEFASDQGAFHLTVSLGIAEVAEEESLAQLMARADEALYAAKRGGRNRVEVG